MERTTALYFRREDYVPFWRRLLVDLVDGLVVMVVFFILTAVPIAWESVPVGATLLSCVAVLFGYLVGLKATRFGTLGYRIGGARIVGLDGRRPGLLALTLRMMFLVFGPIAYFIDLAWLSGDPHRQTIHDKLAQTYVVKRKAEPIGAGTLLYCYYEICGYNFLFREVEEVTEV